MSRVLIAGVRLIDPILGLDLEECDLLIEDGLLAEVGAGLRPAAGTTLVRRPGSVVAPSFLDLHCHLREPGQPWKERITRATAAAAAGGYGAICAMANLAPPVDSPARLRRSLRENRAWGRLEVRQFAACSAGLGGSRLTDFAALAAAGAAGFSDDGRHGLSPGLLQEALRQAAAQGRLVAVHPEDEGLLASANGGVSDPRGWLVRPPDAEISAITKALAALRGAPGARLHLQHLSTRRGVELVRQAKQEGLSVTAEVTPHHLMLTAAGAHEQGESGRCNPPLRTERDRIALWEALLDGTIDAIASDHAPHEAAPPAERPPGFSGVQLGLSAVLGQGGALSHLARLVESLTSGPRRVLGGQADGLAGEGIRSDEPASLTWFDPDASWTPSARSWLSLGTNTPFWGRPLKGAVLATYAGGRLVHLDRELVPELDGG